MAHYWPVTLQRNATTGPASDVAEPDGGGRSRRPAGGLLALVVGLVAGVLYVIEVDRPSPWRDEIATLDAARRSAGGILALTAHVDAVHAAYYLLTHAVAHVLPGPVSVLDGRLVSVVAMALAAGLTVLLGRDSDRLATGVAAGLFLAVSPLVSRYAQEARPFATATALAVLASWLLVRAVRGPWWTWVLYAVAVAALGTVEVLALGLLLAHAAGVLATARRRLLPWLAASVVAVAAVSPLLRLVTGQRDQLATLTTPTVRDLADFLVRQPGSGAGVVVAAAAAVYLAWRTWRDRRGALAGGQAVPSLGVAGWVLPVVWAVVVPAVVWAVSLYQPLFRDRYLVFAVPGTALVVGRVLARLPRSAVGQPTAALAVLFVVAAAGLPTQREIRGPAGHGEDVEALDVLIRRVREPGDAVVFAPRYAQRVVGLDPSVWHGLPDRTADPGSAGRILLVESAGTGGPTAAARDVVAGVEISHRVVSTRRVAGFTVLVLAPR